MMNTAAVIDLLASLGAHTPALPNALCRRHRALFDREDPDGIAEAIAVCGRCAELAACRQWADTMDRRKLYGVIAGQHRNNPTVRKR